MKKVLVLITAFAFAVVLLTGCSDDSTAYKPFDHFVNDTEHNHASEHIEVSDDTCSNCAGTGQEVCVACQGTGKTKNGLQCMLCLGKGNKTCVYCDGTGHATPINPGGGSIIIPDINIGGDTPSLSCPKCGGTGKVTCPSCHGQGYLVTTGFSYGGGMYEKRTKCYACSGTGLYMCTGCSGTGRIN